MEAESLLKNFGKVFFMAVIRSAIIEKFNKTNSLNHWKKYWPNGTMFNTFLEQVKLVEGDEEYEIEKNEEAGGRWKPRK